MQISDWYRIIPTSLLCHAVILQQAYLNHEYIRVSTQSIIKSILPV
jgi:hypothetical protein